MDRHPSRSLFFFFNDTATTEIYTLSLHDALPISRLPPAMGPAASHSPPHRVSHGRRPARGCRHARSEEHTSKLQSPCNLVCRLLLEKKKIQHEALLLRHRLTHTLLPTHAIQSR